MCVWERARGLTEGRGWTGGSGLAPEAAVWSLRSGAALGGGVAGLAGAMEGPSFSAYSGLGATGKALSSLCRLPSDSSYFAQQSVGQSRGQSGLKL